MMEERKASKGGVGDRGGGKQQVGQPMQILPEQRANQRCRQPLQRSGLPLVREKKSTGGKRNMMKKIEKTYSRDAMRVWGSQNGSFGVVIPAASSGDAGIVVKLF